MRVWSTLIAVVSLWNSAAAPSDAEVVQPLPLVQPRGEDRVEVVQRVTSTDTFPMAIVAVIDSHVTLDTTYGDTDQDGRNEIIAYSRNLETLVWEVQFFEHQGAGVYVEDAVLGDVVPFATGEI